MVNRHWIVIDTKQGAEVGKFATRYGAMVFVENLKGLPGRYTVVDQIGLQSSSDRHIRTGNVVTLYATLPSAKVRL